jgi:phosphohistidine swiveling domain-containing protein
MTDLDEQVSFRPAVVALDHPSAGDPALTGSKAAALARAARAGLPVLDGFVITTAADAAASRTSPAVRTAWEALTDGGRRPLVVRSSSTTEDLEGSSMAGRYESVVDVTGWERFLEAVTTVLESADAAAEGTDHLRGDEPLGVLVQPMLQADAGGVLFGVDPVTGREDHLVVSASTHGPDAVVSGRVDGTRYVLERDGTVVRVDTAADGAELNPAQRAALADVAGRTADAFGGPQDVEWALDGDRLVLLQSRPVTTEVVGVPTGPSFGRGPVSETFPEPLAPLEEALWVDPLRRGLREALLLGGAAEPSRLDGTPLVVAVRGHVAVDLETTGEVRPTPSLGARLDPRPLVRRLLSAWRIGRLRAALPSLAADVVAACDLALAEVPELDSLTDRQLLAVIGRGQQALQSLHAHEVLMGQLVDASAARLTGTSVALRVLAHARATGVPDDDIPRRHPVVLALAPPRVSPRVTLPAAVEPPPWDAAGERDPDSILREALRLRVRWVQEVTGRAAWVLGDRLRDRGALDTADEVRLITLDDLRDAVLHDDPVRRSRKPVDDRPVPTRFRLTPDGEPVAEPAGEGGSGAGAGGGRGCGPVRHGVDDVQDGCVLVVPTLDGSVAAVLPRLAGLVSETGSVLAHVAILAREAGVPTVVGATGAAGRFPTGTKVVVDGSTGDVEPEARR